MTARYPEPGTVRVHTCRRCGDVYREEWVRREASGFRVSGETREGYPTPSGQVRGCPEHPTHPGPRGPHDFETETVAPEAS